VGIDRPDDGDAPAISRQRYDQPATGPPLELCDPKVAPETTEREAYEAEFRTAVDAEYGTAHGPQDAAPGPWHGDRDRLNPEANDDREARHVHYRALVEAEYRDARLLHADADPLRAFGSASETHPAELRAAMTRLDAAGVEVDMRPDTMSYSPSAVAGQPGRLILDPEASYGAVLHEMSHFADDEAAGIPACDTGWKIRP
jgi:hypothetical protein